MAFWNMAGSGCATDFLGAWPTAEMSFVDPEIAANVVSAGKLQDSPERAVQRDHLLQQMIEDSAPYPAVGMHYIHDVIDPRQTRDYIIQALEISRNRRTDGGGEHRLANWPTKFWGTTGKPFAPLDSIPSARSLSDRISGRSSG